MIPNLPVVAASNSNTQLPGTGYAPHAVFPQQAQHQQRYVMVMVAPYQGVPSPCGYHSAVSDGHAYPYSTAGQMAYGALESPWNQPQLWTAGVDHQSTIGFQNDGAMPLPGFPPAYSHAVEPGETMPLLAIADHAGTTQAQENHQLRSWHQTPGCVRQFLAPAGQVAEVCNADVQPLSQGEQPVDVECKPEPMVDYLSTASESERFWPPHPKSDTSTVPVSLNDLVSCTSSETSSLLGRRRHRRRRGRGGACLPAGTHAADAAAGVELSAAKQAQIVPSTKADIDHRAAALNSMTAEDGRKMMEQLRCGGGESKAAVASMIGSVLVLSLDAIGCRLVQEALEVAEHISREILVCEVKGHVRDAMRSPHANFVIQKIIEVMPVVSASFVAEELTGIAAEVARHRYGCRILCRLLEHHSGAESIATKVLIDELLRDAAHLCHHSFARHVIDSVLEHGTSEQRHKVAVEITGDVLHNARNRNASYVVERAFGFCSTEDQRTIAAKLLDSGPDRVVALAMHDCGSHVVKALLRSKCTKHAQLMRQILKAGEGRLTLSKYGKRVLEEI